MKLFGDLFDFDHNGELDAFEQAAEFGLFMQMMDDEKVDAPSSAELELNGLDLNELDLMDDEERRAAIEYAGLDPDDYDF